MFRVLAFCVLGCCRFWGFPVPAQRQVFPSGFAQPLHSIRVQESIAIAVPFRGFVPRFVGCVDGAASAGDFDFGRVDGCGLPFPAAGLSYAFFACFVCSLAQSEVLALLGDVQAVAEDPCQEAGVDPSAAAVAVVLAGLAQSVVEHLLLASLLSVGVALFREEAVALSFESFCLSVYVSALVPGFCPGCCFELRPLFEVVSDPSAEILGAPRGVLPGFCPSGFEVCAY